MKKHNFGAGPCILPEEVFQKAAEAIIDYNNSGLSILEVSHRSEAFVEIIEEARDLALELLNLKDKGYQVLFLHGGASFQFVMIPYNLLETKAGYLHTGRWAGKAMKEAKKIGNIIEVGASTNKNFNYIPLIETSLENLDYLHLTSNNTVVGTQMKTFPITKTPLVVDMSSDIYSRILDYSQFDLIYAGAQKNVGTAGTTLVIVKEELLGKVSRSIPLIMDYQVLINNKSMYNTPPVFSIYTSLLNLKWLKKQGGIPAMQRMNSEKAKLLYNEIDSNPLFESTVPLKEHRSMMNATFILKDSALASKFAKLSLDSGIHGITGHRSVGGYRASMYNALPLSSVKALVDIMKELERIG